MKGIKTLHNTLKEKHILYTILSKKDPEAYGKLYDLYIEKIYRFILFKVNNREEAEDLTSDVFLKVWNYLLGEKGKEVTSVSGLFYSVARNVVIDFYRQRAKKPTCSLDQVLELASDDGREKEKKEAKQDITALLKSLESLKQDYQEIILLRYIDELSIKEIAIIIGKSSTNVRVLLHRAIKKLQELHEKKI